MIYFKISRNQMNRALTVLNNAHNLLEKEIADYEQQHTINIETIIPTYAASNLSYALTLKEKRAKLNELLEFANFSIKQTKLKEFYIDYEFAKVIKTILFIEERTNENKIS